jgi:hypothetical protein
VYNYPTTVYYGLRGLIRDGISGGYLWPGTQAVSKSGGTGIFPDTSTPPAFYRIQQPSIISGISCGLNTAAGSGFNVTVTVKYKPVGGTITTSNFVVIMGDTATTGSYYNSSISLNSGDLINVQLTYTGSGNNNLASDLTVQLDIF